MVKYFDNDILSGLVMIHITLQNWENVNLDERNPSPFLVGCICQNFIYEGLAKKTSKGNFVFRDILAQYHQTLTSCSYILHSI